MGEENRRFVRRKTLKGGRIVFHDGQSTITCTIRDWSPAGARLEVASSVGIGDEFILVFDDGSPKRQCQVRTPDLHKRRSGIHRPVRSGEHTVKFYQRVAAFVLWPTSLFKSPRRSDDL